MFVNPYEEVDAIVSKLAESFRALSCSENFLKLCVIVHYYVLFQEM